MTSVPPWRPRKPPPPTDDPPSPENLRMMALNARARWLAPQIVGLTVEEAQSLVDTHEGLSIRFSQVGKEHQLYAVVGGVFAEIADGRVVRAE